MKSPFGNMSNILKQAQAMQEQMAKVQEQAATKTVSGTAGGGIVTVTVNGAMDLLSVKIDKNTLGATGSFQQYMKPENFTVLELEDKYIPLDY